MEIYVVKSGDTISAISRSFDVSASRLAYDNGIFGDDLVTGQALIVQKPATSYIVEEGDTLYGIAAKFNITIEMLLRNNSFLLNEAFLIPGRELIISYEEERKMNVDIFGYAYSFIDQNILSEACLYIDGLFPFSYGFNIDGSLIVMNDTGLLAAAERFGNEACLVITPLDKNERFNNELVIMLLSDESLWQVLLSNIIEVMIDKGYKALNIDFEFVPAQFREQFVAFANKAHDILNEKGYKLIICVPPKISDTQQGLLYEGMDYEGLGMAADYIFLMTYEWGYKYGPPMAIAPIPSVIKVLAYAVSKIPPEKIYMGIPNYAYDWPLPYKRGETSAETIGNTEAVKRAFRYKTEILYDEQSKAPYYYYKDNGVEHVLWFEDIRSIAEKYKLIEDYGFTGAGYWNLMREFKQNWTYVNSIKK